MTFNNDEKEVVVKFTDIHVGEVVDWVNYNVLSPCFGEFYSLQIEDITSDELPKSLSFVDEAALLTEARGATLMSDEEEEEADRMVDDNAEEEAEEPEEEDASQKRTRGAPARFTEEELLAVGGRSAWARSQLGGTVEQVQKAPRLQSLKPGVGARAKGKGGRAHHLPATMPPDRMK